MAYELQQVVCVEHAGRAAARARRAMRRGAVLAHGYQDVRSEKYYGTFNDIRHT
jgi:hypothetical protein